MPSQLTQLCWLLTTVSRLNMKLNPTETNLKLTRSRNKMPNSGTILIDGERARQEEVS